MMNREQRRAKNKTVKVINKVAAWNAIETRIQMNRADDTTHVDQAELLSGPFLHLTMLQKDKLTDAGFVDINEAVCTAFCLAGELYINGDAKAKQHLNQTTIIYTTAANALAAIGSRQSLLGRYEPNDDELQAIRACIDMYSQLIAVAPRGLVLRALKQAEKMVTAQLKAAQKIKQEQAA